MCLCCHFSPDKACAFEAPLLLFHIYWLVFCFAESGLFFNEVELEDVLQRCIWCALAAAEHPVYGNRLHQIHIKILENASSVGHWVLDIWCFTLEVCSIWTSLFADIVGLDNTLKWIFIWHYCSFGSLINLIFLPSFLPSCTGHFCLVRGIITILFWHCGLAKVAWGHLLLINFTSAFVPHHAFWVYSSPDMLKIIFLGRLPKKYLLFIIEVIILPTLLTS